MRPALSALARRRACLALMLSPALAGIPRAGAVAEGAAAGSSPSTSYLDRLRAFKSNLVVKGPAQPFKPTVPGAGTQEILYSSGALALKAWAAFPADASPGRKVPGVVFFHGGFAFAGSDFDAARPFLDAGFAVLCPMLRAENGNPGYFECLLGEIDDAGAAIEWLASQPNVDAARVYTFGHSIGGIVSALLSLRPNGVRLGGSAGGMFGPRMFDKPWLKPHLPFAPAEDPREREMRVLIGNVPWMLHRHDAYVGVDDADQETDLAAREIQPQPRLNIIKMPGDHITSLGPSMKAFIDTIKADG